MQSLMIMDMKIEITNLNTYILLWMAEVAI